MTRGQMVADAVAATRERAQDHPNLTTCDAPWSAIVDARVWSVERAEQVTRAPAPNADYSALPTDDDDGWDVAALAEVIFAEVMGDPMNVPEAWTIGPWWERLTDSYSTAESNEPDEHAFSRVPRHFETTARHTPRHDGQFTTHRRMSLMPVGGRRDRTADGRPIPAHMAAFAALLPEDGATTADAVNVIRAMRAQDVIPPDYAPDTRHDEAMRAIVAVADEDFRRAQLKEGWRQLPLKGRRVTVRHERGCNTRQHDETCQMFGPPTRGVRRKCDQACRRHRPCDCTISWQVVEHTGHLERTRVATVGTFTRGIPIMADASDGRWTVDGQRTYVPTSTSDVHRVTYLRNVYDKPRRDVRIIGPMGQRPVVTSGSNVKRAIVNAHKASRRTEVITAISEGQTLWQGWTLAVEHEATRQGRPAIYAATNSEGDQLTGTVRQLAGALASMT